MIFFPNAKINIGLNIVEKRSDGYHNIETVFYPTQLCDILEIIEGNNHEKGTCRLNVTGLSIDCRPEENLLVKVYNRLNSVKPLPGVSVFLHKLIPMGAGLGGGSSDAAFMLKGLNDMFTIGLTIDELEAVAAEIGSDCPFFIRNQPVFAYEKGNCFKEIFLFLRGYRLLIVHPGIHVSTKDAYSTVTPAIPEKKLTGLIELPVEHWKDAIKNDFEYSVFKQYPEIEEIKDKLYRLGALYASMSGSGSTVYGLFTQIPEDISILNGCYTWNGRLQ